MHDRREQERLLYAYPVTFAPRRGAHTGDCIDRGYTQDVSATGARVLIPPGIPTPGVGQWLTVRVGIPGALCPEGVFCEAEVVWVRPRAEAGTELGVHFQGLTPEQGAALVAFSRVLQKVNAAADAAGE